LCAPCVLRRKSTAAVAGGRAGPGNTWDRVAGDGWTAAADVKWSLWAAGLAARWPLLAFAIRRGRGRSGSLRGASKAIRWVDGSRTCGWGARSYAADPGRPARTSQLPTTDQKVGVRVPSGAQHHKAAGLRKRRPAAFQDSSMWTSGAPGARLFRNCSCRGQRRRAATARPVRILGDCGHGAARVDPYEPPAAPMAIRDHPRGEPGGTLASDAWSDQEPRWSGQPALPGRPLTRIRG
jgi:hypothetical protein